MVFDRKEYYRQYYIRNRERCIKYVKKYNQKNKNKIKTYRKKYDSKPEVLDKRKKYFRQYNKKPKRIQYNKEWLTNARKDPDYRKREYLKNRRRLDNNNLLKNKKRLESKRYYNKNKVKRRMSSKIWRLNNETKLNAQNTARNKIPILFPYCLYCGSNNNLQRHHEDYRLALRVIILCKKCHSKKHRKILDKF